MHLYLTHLQESLHEPPRKLQASLLADRQVSRHYPANATRQSMVAPGVVERTHLFRIVGSSDHDTDGLTIELLASQAGENADAKNNRVQGVPSGYDMRDDCGDRQSESLTMS